MKSHTGETMSKLSVFEKWQEVEKRGLENGMGELFNPETGHKFYDVDFFKLTYKKHYDVSVGCSIGADGVKPTLSMYFTPKGIKKLLKTNQKMIDEVNKEYEGLQELDGDFLSPELKSAIADNMARGER